MSTILKTRTASSVDENELRPITLPSGRLHYTTTADTDRLFPRLEMSETGHLLWPGAKSKDGYGEIRMGGQVLYVHRVAFELAWGPIPQGMELDHLCRIRHCASLFCLEMVTKEENMRRGEGPAAINARKTECKWGHAFDEANTRLTMDRNGRVHRTCRACARRRKAESAQRPVLTLV